jgi:hypothetical protein
VHQAGTGRPGIVLTRSDDLPKFKEDQTGKPGNQPIDKFSHGIDAVWFLMKARIMADRNRFVRIGR